MQVIYNTKSRSITIVFADGTKCGCNGKRAKEYIKKRLLKSILKTV